MLKLKKTENGFLITSDEPCRIEINDTPGMIAFIYKGTYPCLEQDPETCIDRVSLSHAEHADYET